MGLYKYIIIIISKHIQPDGRREKEKCRHQDGDHLQEDRRGLPVYVAALILFAVVFAVFFLLVFMFSAAAAYLKAAVGQCSAGRLGHLGQDLFNYTWNMVPVHAFLCSKIRN
ncbi:uncharacterized protein [Gossypium hirsutum]|uniref:Uncharacterized protein n=1 Tax=Gossypium hirsutum TaxID=3635 RepID=A0A1U8IAG3_GOSHI|nr:uncharacterized protein LOC107894334 [Gossypium hirsutum]